MDSAEERRVQALEEEVRQLRRFLEELLRALRTTDDLDGLKRALPSRLPLEKR
jgi:hypothetical protein